ncbi:immunity repressor [Mycobacterium phage Paito]|uniref:Immunity repressor n=1 Tax=Mycobacterium phage Paito TaxID=2315544 RepID=A0A386KGC2_9CAUD|nr:transcriptional repressor [Mycobacterium phage Paito]AYD84618.1 immunity repressor [Mycobacterium phage Paito]
MSQALDMGRIPPSRLSYRLLIARLEAGLKQEELAALMGCGRTVVSNAEKGKGPVRKIVLNAWALATGVPISWLEHGDGGWYPPEDPPAGDEKVRPEGFEPPTFCLEVGAAKRHLALAPKTTGKQLVEPLTASARPQLTIVSHHANKPASEAA